MTKLHNAVHGFAKQFLPDLHHLPSHTGAKNALFFLGLFGFMTMAFSEVSANVNISTSLNNNVMTIEKLRVTTDGQVNSPWKVELDTNGIRLDLGNPVGVLKRNSVGYITQGVVNGIDIDNGAIGTNHIQNGAVGTAQIASGAITTTQIQDGAITCDKINIPGFTCSGVQAPNSACPTGQFLQGLSASGGAICAPIQGGTNSLPTCSEGEVPIYANGGWGCQNLGTEGGDQLWTKQSFLSPHIYNKNRNGGRVGVGLTTPQTTLHVRGTFLVEGNGGIRCGGKQGILCPDGYSCVGDALQYDGFGMCILNRQVRYDFLEMTYNEGGLNAYPGIQRCSCDQGPDAAECYTQPNGDSYIDSNDVGQYCYDIYDATNANGSAYGSSYGGTYRNWIHYIYERSMVAAKMAAKVGVQEATKIDVGASGISQEGGTCYRNRAGSKECDVGLVCRDAQGNDPTLYDGVGTCVKEGSTNSCGTRYNINDNITDVAQFNQMNEEYKTKNGTDMPRCSCDTNTQGQQCDPDTFIGNNLGDLCYDENQPGPTEKRLPVYHMYQLDVVIGPDCSNTNVCGTLYAWRTLMGWEEHDKLNNEYREKFGTDIPSCQCDTGNGEECGINPKTADAQGLKPTKTMGLQYPQYGWDPKESPWVIQDSLGDYCVDRFTDGKEPTYNIFHIVDKLGENCAHDNACTNTGNMGTANSLATPDPSAIFYVGQNAVGILTKNPQYALDVVGTVRAAQVLTLSDARLKKDITPINDALKKLMGIEGYIYTLKVDGSTQYGVLAQQVEEFFPYAVTTAENGLKSVNYNSLIAPMIQAIHELDTKMQNLENTYQSNEVRIQALEKKLTK